MKWNRNPYATPTSTAFGFLVLLVVWFVSVVALGVAVKVNWLVFLLGWSLL